MSLKSVECCTKFTRCGLLMAKTLNYICKFVKNVCKNLYILKGFSLFYYCSPFALYYHVLFEKLISISDTISTRWQTGRPRNSTISLFVASSQVKRFLLVHLALAAAASPINFSLFDHLSGVKRLVELVVAATVGPVAPLPVFDGPPDVEPEPLIRR